jgi:hypothetical protein
VSFFLYYPAPYGLFRNVVVQQAATLPAHHC